MVEHHVETYYVLLMTINITLSLVVMLAACLCCRKKVPKNELLGLEGMVKLKNPDEVVIVTAVQKSDSQAELNTSSVSNADSEKRASTAAHRSLPDIPLTEMNGDNGSELYETVADKRVSDAQNNRDKSPAPSLKKQTSVSQHSSISQADDVSSPYSRVKNSPHDYAKVRATEHPYAQLNAPTTGAGAASSGASTSQIALNNDSLNRTSHHSESSHNLNDSTSQIEIPAASAIAGMISASQDLPYMTPPIANQHFSGDSQDSSKGYTSISVREPLANILAQQPIKPSTRNAPLSRDVNDSHYATVSDDSDETYAAIEDPNVRNIPNTAADIYTSGSETYAQIQPMQSNSIVVSVEINTSSVAAVASAAPVHFNNIQIVEQNTTASVTHYTHTVSHNRPISEHVAVPVLPPVDNLRAQIHSRQASSSSNNSSSMGNIGSPKPEKRQANSPLPPTPKSNATLHTVNNAIAPGRNSVISVIESGGGILDSSDSGSTNVTILGNDVSPQRKKKSLSPSKDIEGMYAKVMKKNKFSRNSPSSQNSSPIMTRKGNDHLTALGIAPLDKSAAETAEARTIHLSTGNGNTADKSRTRSNSYGAKDHGYETIPFDAERNASGIENRKSDCYANFLQKERQQEGAAPSMKFKSVKPPIDSGIIYGSEKHYETIANPNSSSNSVDPGYETLNKDETQSDPDNEKKSSDYDPNYEVLKMPNAPHSNLAGLSDDGYAKVMEKKRLNIDEDGVDGYSKVKGEDCEDAANAGYSTIGERKDSTSNHNYASILETKATNISEAQDNVSDYYARIAEARIPAPPNLPLSSASTPVRGENEAIITRPPELAIASPSSVTSSLLNNSSTTSSINMTTTSTISSRQTPSSSQYESLTGSDTDPNYESVSYMNTSSRENPYERLQTDTQISSSSLTPDDRGSPSTATTTSTELINIKANGPHKLISTELGTDVVDDYFQV